MIKKEQLISELKIGKLTIDEEGNMIIEEYDKDGNSLGEESLTDVFEDYVGKEYIKMKIEYIKEI